MAGLLTCGGGREAEAIQLGGGERQEEGEGGEEGGHGGAGLGREGRGRLYTGLIISGVS